MGPRCEDRGLTGGIENWGLMPAIVIVNLWGHGDEKPSSHAELHVRRFFVVWKQSAAAVAAAAAGAERLLQQLAEAM